MTVRSEADKARASLVAPAVSLNNCTLPTATSLGDVAASTSDNGQRHPSDTKFAASSFEVDPSALFRELWAVNGGFDEPWMAAHNAEVWGAASDGTYRLDDRSEETAE